MQPGVFLFPGQSSVSPDSISRARAAHPAAAPVAARARAVLGGARADRYLDAGGARLETNRDIQITVFLATQMYLAALHAEGLASIASLGLSLGEYSHLVDIGALDFDAALSVIDERGRCYDESPPGVMATVLAVDRDTVEEVVARARAHGTIVISNINAPTQHVIAGEAAAVNQAIAVLEDECLAHVTIIEKRVPMHSPLMAPVAAAFAPALEHAPWRAAAKPYLPNVTAAPIAKPSAADYVIHLTRHVSEPVLWQQSVDRLVAEHPDAWFVEVGPGGVLHNLLGRAWKATRAKRVDAPHGGDPRTHLAGTVEALRA